MPWTRCCASAFTFNNRHGRLRREAPTRLSKSPSGLDSRCKQASGTRPIKRWIDYMMQSIAANPVALGLHNCPFHPFLYPCGYNIAPDNLCPLGYNKTRFANS